MLKLPKETLLRKALPKSAIFARFKISPAARRLFDEQISRLVIIAEISPQTANVAAGEAVRAIFVVQAVLKVAACDPRNLALLAKNIDQQMIFVLQYESQASLAMAHKGRVVVSAPAPLAAITVKISGLDLDKVWAAMLAEISGIDWQPGEDIDEALDKWERQAKIKQKIAQLEQKARTEAQPRRKWKLVKDAEKLKVALNEK